MNASHETIYTHATQRRGTNHKSVILAHLKINDSKYVRNSIANELKIIPIQIKNK
jgi:hypothetical protein